MAGEGAREHARVVGEILAACGARQDCRIWPNNTGTGRALNHDGVIRFGLKGSADILGIYHGGRLLAVEVKTGAAKQSKQQRAFQVMVERFGGIYLIVRSAQDAVKQLDALAS